MVLAPESLRRPGDPDGPPRRRAPASYFWERMAGVFLRLFVELISVLMVTGTILAFVYQPASGGSSPGDVQSALHTVHAVAAAVLVPVALGLLVFGLAAAIDGHRRRRHGLRVRGPRAWMLGAWGLVVAGAGTLSGPRLAFQRLALSSRVSDSHGVLTAAFDNAVNTVVVAGSQLSRSDYAWSVVVHAAVIPLVALVLVLSSLAWTARS